MGNFLGKPLVLGNLHLLLLWERRQRADQKEKTHEKFRILQTEVL